MHVTRVYSLAILYTVLLAMTPAPAVASNACATRAITTSADVSVSDGSHYRTETFFHSRNAAAIRFIRENGGALVVEGPFGWTADKSGAVLAPPERQSFTRIFALGHQFHALLLFFDEIMDEVRESALVEFQGKSHRAKSGNYPYGGVVHLMEAEGDSLSPGMRLELTGAPPMEITFGDWRNVEGRRLPFFVKIDDETRTFDYRYTAVDIGEKSPLWFFDGLGAAPPDEVAVYRLHRRLLAAHCLGDAGMIANLTAPEALSANRGELTINTGAEMKARFTALFRTLLYSEYRDLAEPVIEIAKSGDLGWAAVEVRAVGKRKSDGKPFDDQWAWIMLAKKIDGNWVHAGIASNRKNR